MAAQGFKRKLTATLSADAVGYSRLMGEDEASIVTGDPPAVTQPAMSGGK
jgi:hypothetical protein